MISAFNKIYKTSDDAIGDIFVKYLDPINLNQFCKKMSTNRGLHCPRDLENSA